MGEKASVNPIDGVTSPRVCYEAAFAALNAAGIEVCLMRDDPAQLDGLAELDLLVARADLARTAAVLAYAGWELLDGGMFHPHKRALLMWVGDDFLKLDLHAAVIDGPLIYMDARWFMGTARPAQTRELLPSDEAWLLHVLLHTVLAKSVLDPRFRARVRSLCAGELDRAAMLEQAGRFGLSAVVESVLADPLAVLSDAGRVAGLQKQARRRLYLRPGNALRALMYRVAWSVGPALGLRRGFLLAVVGPDGAGKTSFVEALCAELERVHVPARTTYMGPWQPTRLPTSRFLARLGANPLDELPGTGPEFPAWTRATKLAKGLVKRYLWYASALLDIWARFFAHVLPRLMLRRVVLADRYLHDLEVGYYNALVGNSPRLRRWLVRLAPRPRATILLDHDAETIWARKQEYPLSEIRAALRAYRRVAREHGLEVMRTDRSPQELAREFVLLHWREIVRWRRDGLRSWWSRWRATDNLSGAGFTASAEPGAQARSRLRSREHEPTGPLRVEWIESRAQLERIATEWDAVVRAANGDNPFLLSDYLLTWLTHFGEGRALQMAVVRAGDELLGGLPLYLQQRRRTRVLAYPGADDYAVANRTDILAARAYPHVLEEILAALADRPDWDLLELSRLHVKPERFAGVQSALQRHGLLLMHQHCFPGYLIDVPPTLGHYLARRTKSFRRKLRSADQQAAQLGGLSFRALSGGAAVEELFERFVALSRHCYQTRDRRSTFEDERLCAFFRELLQRFEALGILDAHALDLGGEPIAIGFGYTLEGNLNDVLTTFDARHAQLMPGSLLTRAQLEHAIERGSTVLNFYSGDNPHKLRWADRQEPVFGLLVARGTLTRRAAFRARSVARKVRGMT